MGSIIDRLKKLKPINYVTIAIAVHAAVFLIWGSMQIFPGYTTEVLFKGSFKKEEPSTKEKKAEEKKPLEKKVITEIPAHIIKPSPEMKERLVVKRELKTPAFVRPPKLTEPVKIEPPVKKQAEPAKEVLFREKAQRRETWKQFSKQFKISGRGRSISTQATLTVYEAQASGMEAGIDKYAIPNLMGEIDKRTNVKANPATVVASVKDYAGLSKCPYVYMAGRGDFSFSAEELTNLRKYIMGGGTVFADNCLPGKRSGFDIAFRREMKRILPDREFEILPMNHPIFNIFYQFYEVPKGLNFRNDPIEVIMIDDKPGVLYTLNGYSFFWESRLDAVGNVDHGYRDDYTYAHGSHWDQLEYENINQESVEAAYQLGINILVYLLSGIGKY